MKYFFTCIIVLLFTCICTELRAEEFVAKSAVYEIKGEKIELSDLSSMPKFQVYHHPKEGIVEIQSSAGRLILKQGIFCYGYSGVHKGMRISARAYLENGKLTHIVYEEFDEYNKAKATINYYAK